MGDKKKILLVDDERDLVVNVAMRLEHAGYEVLSSYDGVHALEQVRKEKPDLIILDIMLPKMDGYKVCGLLKKDARYARIPIIMFTAKAHEADEKLAREVGADAYIIKPFEAKVLMAKIAELLESRKAEGGYSIVEGQA